MKFYEKYSNPPAFARAEEAFQPVRLFDNLGCFGTRFVSMFVLETDEGLMLIDALWPGVFYETLYESGMRRLGYDPKDVKKLLITHGHADHYGIAGYLQRKYDPEIYIGEVDYRFAVETHSEIMKDDSKVDFTPSGFMREGDVMTLGNAAVTVAETPGHTPGGLSFLIPVYDEGRPHTAALWGGTALRPDAASNRQYLRSLAHFRRIAEAAKADAEISNHQFVDNGIERMQVLSERTDGVANPFVIGAGGYGRFLDMLVQMCEDWLKKHPD